jgi:hypothetical protein
MISVLVVLWLMDGWAFQVSNEVQTSPQKTATQSPQLNPDPLVENITLEAKSTMWDGVQTYCWVNIAIALESNTAMNLTIYYIRIWLTSSNNREPLAIGILWWGGYEMLTITNTTGLCINGEADITPPTTSEGGIYYLGVGIAYNLGGSLQEYLPSEIRDGAQYMMQVELVPTIFQAEQWNAAFWSTLLGVCVIYIADRRYQFL